jgi:hypothetical protein
MKKIDPIAIRLSDGREVKFEVGSEQNGKQYFVLGVRRSGSSLLNTICQQLASCGGRSPVQQCGTAAELRVNFIHKDTIVAIANRCFSSHRDSAVDRQRSIYGEAAAGANGVRRDILGEFNGRVGDCAKEATATRRTRRAATTVCEPRTAKHRSTVQREKTLARAIRQ